MEGVTAHRSPTTGQLKRLLFDSRRRRRWFIGARIVAPRASFDPLELREQCPGLGPVIVFAWAPYRGAIREDHLIEREVALVSRADIEGKQETAHEWIKSVSSRGIYASVVVYTLTSDGHDFATMKRLELPWMPERIEPGDRIFYCGIAHPFPGARGIELNVDGVFEITDVVFADRDELWWEVHDLRVGDDLYLSEPLLTAATFLSAEASVSSDAGAGHG